MRGDNIYNLKTDKSSVPKEDKSLLVQLFPHELRENFGSTGGGNYLKRRALLFIVMFIVFLPQMDRVFKMENRYAVLALKVVLAVVLYSVLVKLCNV